MLIIMYVIVVVYVLSVNSSNELKFTTVCLRLKVEHVVVYCKLGNISNGYTIRLRLIGGERLLRAYLSSMAVTFE